MNKNFLILISIFILILIINFIYASDVLLWQGQYYTGTTFNTGTYEFNFSVYDALTGGNICYSNLTTLTTGNFGEWKTEQYNVSISCNDVSKDYYLSINIDGADQTPRRRLTQFNFLRKNVDEITLGNLQSASQVVAPIVQANTQVVAPIVQANTQVVAPIVQANTQVVAPIVQANTQVVAPIVNATTQIVTTNLTATTGFFSYLGSLVNRITKLFVQNIDVSGNVNASNYTLNGTTIQGWSDIFSGGGLIPLYLESNLDATNVEYVNIFTIALTPSKINIVNVYLAQSSSVAGVAVQNRAIISEAGPVGICTFNTQTGETSQTTDNIAVSTDSSDTNTANLVGGVNTPVINRVTCTILADANQKNLIFQFNSEASATVTTYAGSYYTNAVN